MVNLEEQNSSKILERVQGNVEFFFLFRADKIFFHLLKNARLHPTVVCATYFFVYHSIKFTLWVFGTLCISYGVGIHTKTFLEWKELLVQNRGC